MPGYFDKGMEKLEDISLNLDIAEIAAELHIKSPSDLENAQIILQAAKPLIKCEAAYKVCYIEKKLEDAIIIDAVRLKSRVLRKILDKVWRVFPYVLTIGSELEEKISSTTDLLEKYYLDTIGNMALHDASKSLEKHLRSRYAIYHMSNMSPGSLQDWPIEEQQPLFLILKGVEKYVGVRLSESLFMIPRKSVSGIYFQTKKTFQSCQLCPRKGCEGRRARYDKDLAREYGILT